jgi:hypothetical protein
VLTKVDLTGKVPAMEPANISACKLVDAHNELQEFWLRLGLLILALVDCPLNRNDLNNAAPERHCDSQDKIEHSAGLVDHKSSVAVSFGKTGEPFQKVMFTSPTLQYLT